MFDIPELFTEFGARNVILFSELFGHLAAGNQLILSDDDSHVVVEFQFPEAILLKNNGDD